MVQRMKPTDRAVVFTVGLRCERPEDNQVTRVRRLAEAMGLGQADLARQLVAVKVHVGERGNAAFMRPTLVRPVVDLIRERGGTPFLTETNTLYTGTRSNAAAHLATTLAHGFGPEVTGAPMVIADGLTGRDAHKVPVAGDHFREVAVAAAIYEADALVVISHFKGHEITGFGGALKNLGMGCCARAAKLAMHASVRPSVLEQKCVRCGTCLSWCAVRAIRQDAPGGPVTIDPAACQGCGECLVACRVGAIKINWEQDAARVAERMVEHAAGVVASKPGRVWYLNLITDVVPLCDCYGFSDAAVVPDLGFAASTDPVALDSCCADLVNAQPGLADTALPKSVTAGADKFAALHEGVDPWVQIRHAEKLGLGHRQYQRKSLGGERQ